MMMVGAVAVLVIIIIIRNIIVFGKKINNIPAGPRGLPLIGNLVDEYLHRLEPHVYLLHLSQKYGPLATLHHGSTPVLVVSSMKMANQILKFQDTSFCSRPSVLGQQKLAYGGIDIAFSPFNDHWKQMRKLCALHLLSPKQVLSFRSTREDEISRMIANINDNGVNLSAMAMSLASNLITRVAFGRRYDDDEFEKRRLDRLVMEAQALMVSFYFSDHFPALSWVDRASGLLGRLHKNCAELEVFYQQLIDEHRRPTPPPDHRQDIIDLMFQLKHAAPTSTTHDWDNHIKALLMDLFVAGTDTVAATIVWTMTALMLKPSVMNKLQTEIRGLGERSMVVNEDDIDKLPYLKAVVLEALRLYPPAPLLYRTQILTQKSARVGEYDIEPGTRVIINGWAIGRDPETWENAEEFEPERFMGMSRMDALEMMLPFGGGRRGCPGKEMGLVSIHLALANLLYFFDWALPLDLDQGPSIDTQALPGLTMHKKKTLLLLPTPYHP